MESQLKHPQHNMINDGDDHQDEQHGEKKSVLKKVKAKARKIKETIKKHGHLHGHDQHDQHRDQRGYDPEFDEEDEDEDESDELEEAPEVHGAPIYESQELARNPMVGVEGNQGLHPIMERTDEPAVGKDHTRLTVPTSHGHVEGGQTGESNIIITPQEEAPIAPRNTLLSSGEDRHLGSEATEPS